MQAAALRRAETSLGRIVDLALMAKKRVFQPLGLIVGELYNPSKDAGLGRVGQHSGAGPGVTGELAPRA